MKNLNRISAGILIIILIHSCTKEDDNLIRDADGNVYTSVTIGTQEWLVENLKTTRYRNGDLIGTTTPATLDISSEDSAKYQWAYDGLECSVATYGRLYTWYVASDIRGVCPTGWHVPDLVDWVTLHDFYMEVPAGYIVGAELMEPGTTHWNRSDIIGTNETGFTALPSGIRYSSGTFNGMTQDCQYWSSHDSKYGENNIYFPIPICCSYGDTPSSMLLGKKFGLSIRCIKDSI